MDTKSKLDLGYIFKLHTKQYMSTITSNREIIKKTNIIPIMVFDVPLFATKKSQSKKMNKKAKL